MSGLNKAMLIGNLGMDPELKHTQSGQAILRLRLAVTERWSKDGEKQERTEWFTVIMWGKRGEALSRMLAKGERVYVEGRLQTREWEDKDGNKRSTTELVAHELLFLGGRREGGGGQRQSAPASGGYGGYGGYGGGSGGGFGDDDIPFARVDGRLS